MDRAALVELAESFGGRRFACGHCQAKMRSLILRGVDVDLCFHCGALWLDRGELELLSNNRHQGLTTTTTTTTTLQVRPQGTVRLDARHPLLRSVGRIFSYLGGLVGAAVGLHLLDPPKLILAVFLLLAGLAMTRRRIVDVFPRARRFLRSRRFMPTDARDEDAERLDDRTFVVVRPLLHRHFAFSVFADSCGRTLAPLHSGSARSVGRQALIHARRLGAVVVVDPRLGGSVPAGPALPVFPDAFSMVVDQGSSAFTLFQAVGTSGAPVFTMQNAVPARGDESRAERLALCFCIELPSRLGTPGARLRFHDAGRDHTVVVGDAGEPLAAIHRRSNRGLDWLTVALAGRATRIHLVWAPLGLRLPFFDDAGRRPGHLTLDDRCLTVELDANADVDVRFACCVLAAHAALEAGG